MIIGNPLLLKKAADSTADPVTRSLRFNDADNSHLYFDPTATHDSSTVYTFSCWAKLGEMDAESYEIFTAGYYTSSTNQDLIYFGHNADSKLRVWIRSTADSTNTTYTSTAVFRDPSAWYHLLLVRNGASLKVYVNNSEVISQTISSTQRYGVGNGYPMHIGSSLKPTSSSLSSYSSFDGLFADVYFTDGYAKAPTDFIESNDYGGYKPKEYTGSFGTNGFHLKFDDSSDIGVDSTSNSNDFTATNLSSHDVMLDTPTKNYATFNPLYNDNHSASNKDTLTEGNCEADYTTGSSGYYTPTTVGFSTGKFYFEVYVVSGGSGTMVGVVNESATGYVGSDSNGVGYHDSNGTIYNNGNTGTSYSTFTTGDIIGCAFDADTKKVWFAKNGSWNGNPSTGTGQAGTLSGTLFAAIRAYTGTLHINAGADPTFAGNKTSGQDTNQSEFYYLPPTDFKSLNTSNLADPTVTPSENIGIALYNGTSSSNSITGLGFQPDLLYTKSRSTSGSSPKWFDSLRGVTKRLETNTAGAETTQSTELTSFDSDGFTLGSGSGSNYSGRTYVGWCWKAHQSPTSNTTTYTVKVEDNSGDAWDSSGTYYDSSTYLPSVYMEIFENRNSSLVSLGKVAVRYYDSSGNSNSDLSEQTYTLECADLNAIAVKWYYDTSGDGQQYDSPNSYNDYLNDQKITILDGATSEWTTNNYSNADGTSYNYSPPSGWANGDTLKAATTSYNGSDTATLTSGGSSGPTEQYNADAGFTIISYAGDGSTDGDTQTLDHSLGVPLEFVIAKARTSNDGYDTGNWIVWHKDLATGGKYLYLNSSSATRAEASGYYLINTATSGTQHQVVVNNGSDSSSYNYNYLNSGPDNGTGEDYILYGWAGVEGYSKFGKYTGNGSTDGPFIYTGFRPAFVLWKRVSGSSNSWNIMDNKREGYNPQNDLLFPDSSAAESNVTDQDLLSNGFKLRTTGAGRNASSETFIYAAWAEVPFSKANAR